MKKLFRIIVVALFLFSYSFRTSWAQYTDGRAIKTNPIAYKMAYANCRYSSLHSSANIEEIPAQDLYALGEGVGMALGVYLDRRGCYVLNVDLGTSFTNSIPITLFNGTESGHPDFYEQNTFRSLAASLRVGLEAGRMFKLSQRPITIIPLVGLNCSVHYWGRGLVKTSTPQWTYTQHVDIFRHSPWFLPSARFYNVGVDGGIMALWKHIMMAVRYNRDLLSVVPRWPHSFHSQDFSLTVGYCF